MRIPLLLVTALLAPACHAPQHASPPPTSGQLERAREQLLAADRDFAAATAERRIEAWMEVMTTDSVRLSPLGGAVYVGLEAIRAADAPFFADPELHLTWSPTSAHAFDDGRHGMTTGRYEVRRRPAEGDERLLASGSYLTLWRREADGPWKVILDTGTPDPPSGTP